MLNPTLFIDVLIYTAVAVGAMSGVLAARQLQMDPFGAMFLAASAALGGGTLRDVLLDLPIFWLQDNSYLYAVLLPAVFAMYWPLKRGWPYRILNIADAVGLAMFTIIGMNKALAAEFSPLVAIIMGIFTGVAGGIIRDVLANQVPLIFRQEIYATASLFGALIFSLLLQFSPLSLDLNMAIAMITILLIRLAAIRWRLTIQPLRID